MTDAKPVVFVVDDDQGVRESVKILLRSIDVEAETFASHLFDFGTCGLGKTESSDSEFLLNPSRSKYLAGNNDDLIPPFIL